MELGSREDLLLYPDVDRDLAGTIFANRFAYTGFTAFAELIKSKAYTMTRIHRALLRIALDLRADGPARPLFARAAGFTAQGARLLAEIKKHSTIPILTKNSETEILTEEARRLYDEEIRLANIYRLIREGKSGRAPQNVLKTGLIRV
jgi:predicted nucleotidyltransferase